MSIGQQGATRQKRCPECGASNPPGAQWCGQCLKRFAAPPPPPPPPAAPGAPPGPRQQKPLPVGQQRGAFRVTESGVMWRCLLCETENPMDSEFCSGCDAPLASTLRPPESKRPQRDPNTTALVSLFMPGAGHAYLGMWGQALARGFISVWVVFTALIGAIQGSMLLGVVFGIAAVGLWVAAAHDAYREASHMPDAVLLKGRAFLYVVLGLLVLLTVMLFIGAMQAQSV